jgi:hypothetical protein
MRIKFLKQLLWVLNTVFVLAIVAIALRYFLLGGPKRTGPRSAEQLLPPLPEGGGKIKGEGKLPSASYSVIWDLAIHGLPPVKVDPVGPRPDVKTIPPLARDYDLAWTLVDENDPWQSYAHLVKKADPTVAVNAPLGYMVEGVWKVIRVDNWEAEFEQEDSGETVILKMSRTATDGMVRPVGDPGAGQPQGGIIGGPPELDPVADFKNGPQRGRARKIGTNHWQMGPGEVQWWDRNGEKVLEEVALQQEKDPETGRPAGVRIRSFSDSSMLKARGLLPGDVVKSINGTPVNSKQEAVAYVKGPGKDATRFVVVVERKGRLVTFTYDRPR